MREKITTESIIERFKKIHGDTYLYDKVVYVRSFKKVIITCKIHGDFEQTPSHHLQGKGCNKCGNLKISKKLSMNTEEFVRKAQLVHKNKYDYSKVVYKLSREKVTIICPIHGEFIQTPNDHLTGYGCRECGNEKLSRDRIQPFEYFLKKTKEVHGDTYLYDEKSYISMNTKTNITCKKHGVFSQIPSSHIQGRGCPVCRWDTISQKLSKTHDEFLKDAKAVHGDKYLYEKVEYVNNHTPVKITCPKHGDFMQAPGNHLQGKGCQKCVGKTSAAEQAIREFLKNEVEVKQSCRTTIKPLELDIYIKSLKIGIEYNGLYFHSDVFLKNDYHLYKLLRCEEKGVRLIQIFEDEWLEKEEICKSRLLNIIGKTPNKIFARKCEIREVTPKEAKEFLNANHIQGNVNSKVKLGLYYNNELVSLMTFGNLRKNLGQTHKEGHYELLRFCNKLYTNVVGGASKLLKYFERKYQPVKIISYADRRWSNGDLYKSLGFDFVSYSKPNYFYVMGPTRENRFKYRKSELVKQGFDVNKTEKQIMEERGYKRIYDCGTIKIEKTYD